MQDLKLAVAFWPSPSIQALAQMSPYTRPSTACRSSPGQFIVCQELFEPVILPQALSFPRIKGIKQKGAEGTGGNREASWLAGSKVTNPTAMGTTVGRRPNNGIDQTERPPLCRHTPLECVVGRPELINELRVRA